MTTGIKQVAVGKAKRADGDIYDLQGLELQCEPRKEIYIKDGKVMMGTEVGQP